MIEQEREEYWEAVKMFVDGIVNDILTGNLRSKASVNAQAYSAAEHERYVADPVLAAHTLRYSKSPSAGLYFLDGIKDLDLIPPDPFPWKDLAWAAFDEDVDSELHDRVEYNRLPHDEPITAENKPYKVNEQPLSSAQLRGAFAPGKSGYVTGVVPVALNEIATKDLEHFEALLSERLTDVGMLCDLDYHVVGNEGDTLHIYVRGHFNFNDIDNDNTEENNRAIT